MMTSSKLLMFSQHSWLSFSKCHFQKLETAILCISSSLLTPNWSTNQLTGQSVIQLWHDRNACSPINVTFDEFNILSNVTSQSATYQFGASCPISKNKLCLSRERTTLNFNPPIQWVESNFKKIRKKFKKFEDSFWNSIGLKV